MKIGAYAGQIRDIEPVYARQLIAAGSAEDPYALKDEPVSSAPKDGGKAGTDHAAVTPKKRK